jgi:uncharacterized membrane protein
MSMAVAIGVAAGVFAPANSPVSQALVGWNVGVWSYLALMAWMMARADHSRLRRTALANDQGAAVVLGLVVAASVASVVAIVAELAWARHAGAASVSRYGWMHVLLVVSTLVGAWLLLPVVFTLSYASHYYRPQVPDGLRFPDEDPQFQPNYADFLYFAFTLAVAAQTADVVVTSRAMRKLVLLQAVLSFAFNAAILALAINIGAGLLPAR